MDGYRYRWGWLVWGACVLLWLGCGETPPEGQAEPASVPPVSNPAPVPPAAKRANKADTPEAAQAAQAAGPAAAEANPCTTPEPLALTIPAGKSAQTPYGLEIEYLPGIGKVKGLPSFEFRLRHGERRWRVERTMANWNSRMTWRGFCWKGGTPHPEAGAESVVVHVAPVCDAEGKLLELGGCRDVLK